MKDYIFSAKCCRTLLVLLLATCSSLTLKSQLTPQAAGYIDAVAEFGVKNNGTTVTTASLQTALNAAIAQDKGLFLRPGEYLIDGTITALDEAADRADQTIVIQGSSINPNQRAILVLKEGTFPDPNSPGTMLESKSFIRGSADIIDRNIQSVDFKIQANNAGARGLDWLGAEGCSIFDVHMDMTGGLAGFIQLLGSGGSTANISVKGGQFGIDLRRPDGSGNGTQPCPTVTSARFEGQTSAAIHSAWNRGSITLTGCEFIQNPGIPALSVQSKHQTWRFSYGGNYLLTDCIIEYTQADPKNSVIKVDTLKRNVDGLSINEMWPVSHYWNNVYVKNAAFINFQAYPRSTNAINENTADPYSILESNVNGWRHFSEMALSSGLRNQPNGPQYEPIYFDGVRQEDVYQNFQDNVTPSISFADYHSWGKTFPSFESSGAVNLTDFSAVNGDWAPALQAAIDAAASTSSGVVFVPSGQYLMYDGVTMRANTKIVGVANHLSVLLAPDEPGRRYANSATDPYTATPMVQSAIGSDNNILADIGIQALGAFGEHDPTPNAKMSVLWRAGSKSIIRNIHYKRANDGTKFRPSNVLIGTLTEDNWIRLRSLPSPSTLNGFIFRSESATQFFQAANPFDPLPTASKILLETVNGSQRLLTRSIPFNNKADINFTQSNLEIKKNGGGAFTLTSLEIFNGAWNPKGGGDVTIEVFQGSNKKTFTVSIEGLHKPREQAQLVNINQNNVSRVLITSDHQFAIDNLNMGGIILDFESVVGNMPKQSQFVKDNNGNVIEVVIADISSAIYYDPYRDLPLSYLNHPMVKITGGVKWYNHWIHGDTWMDPHLPYTEIENNTDEINIYHFHAQHSQNDLKLLLKGANNVSVFGAKVEKAGLVAKAVNSHNFRFMGHGGLTTSIPGNPMYRFENCTDFLIASPTDELDPKTFCQFCGRGNAILPQAKYGTYTVIADVKGGTVKSHDPFERPILWKNGHYQNPLDDETPVISYSIIASSSNDGSISPSGSISVNEGNSINFTISPDNGFVVDEVFVDGSSIGAVTTYNFNNVRADHTINATFKEVVGSPPSPPGTNGLFATYYNNQNLQGAPSLTRIDPIIDFNWKELSPDPSINVDNFSTRWSGFVQPEFTGNYRFFMLSNDGSRLWIDGVQLVDRWTDGQLQESGNIYLEAGVLYPIVIEQYENNGNARANLYWSGPNVGKQIIPTQRLFPKEVNQPILYTVTSSAENNGTVSPLGVNSVSEGENITFTISAASGFEIEDVLVDGISNGVLNTYSFNNVQQDHTIQAIFRTETIIPPNSNGLFATYFDNQHLEGSPVLTRIDPGVNFNWKEGSPDPEINPDRFSVRWSGYVLPEITGTYKFFALTDDGARLWIDNTQLIDRWSDGKLQTNALIDLEGGIQYPIVLEYYEYTGNARANLFWSGPNLSKQIIPSSRLFPEQFTNPSFIIKNATYIHDSPDISTNLTLDRFVYPNPFSAYFSLNLSMFHEPPEIELFTSMGKIVWSKTFEVGIHRIEEDFLEKLPSGIYYLRAKTSTSQQMGKLTKQ